MDLFTVAASLMMASATLGGFGLLASLIVMERRPRHAGSAARRANLRHRTRNRALSLPGLPPIGGTDWRDCNVKVARLKTGGTSAYSRR